MSSCQNEPNNQWEREGLTWHHACRSPIHQRGAAAAAMLGEPTKAQIAEAYQLTQPAGASNSKKQKKTRNRRTSPP